MVLYGASGHGKVVIDILETIGKKIDFIVDDNRSIQELLGYEVRSNTNEYDEAFISIGSPIVRKRVYDEIKVRKYVTIVHPSAIISKRVEIDDGTVVMPGVVIQTCTSIGKQCIINTGASIDHDCQLGDFVHIAPHATLCGSIVIGDGSWIGAGAVIKQGVKIGQNSIIGAGAVVIEDVPDNTTVIGVPAKPYISR